LVERTRIPRLSLVCASVVLLMISSLATMALTVGVAPANARAQQVGEDWPTYLHDAARSAASNETLLSAANAGQLRLLWAVHTGGPIAASAAAVAGTIYVGSRDGYEYALNADSGAIKWRTYLGQVDARSGCSPPQAGVTSSATVQNGVVYVDALPGTAQAASPIWLRVIQFLLVIGILVCGVLLWREHKRIRALGRRVRVASRRLVRRITARPAPRPPLYDTPTATRGGIPRTSARVEAMRRAQLDGPTAEGRTTTGRTLAQRPGSAGWRQTSETPGVGRTPSRGGQSLWDWAEDHGTGTTPTTRIQQRSAQPDDQSPTARRRVPPPPDADWMR
jgi:hypothetical protein